MVESRFLDIPHPLREPAVAHRYFEEAAAELAGRISRELGPELGGRALPPEEDFGGGSTWTVEVRRQGRLEAVVAIDWSPQADPGVCRISIEDAPRTVLAPYLAGGALSATGGLTGALFAPGIELGLALLGGLLGTTGGLLLARLAARTPAPQRSDTVAMLREFLQETTAAFQPA